MSGISFSIKKTEPAKVIKSQIKEKNEEKKDYVLQLEGREIKSTLAKPIKKELVIPMIGKNKWRVPPSQDKKTGGGADKKMRGGTENKSSEELKLEREAADAVLRDLQETREVAMETDSEVVVPLLLQNQPPVVEGRERDDLADVHLRPDQSTLDEYSDMPIESFGAAMLRGMGWTKGEAIGLTNKGLVEPIEFIARPGRVGLGATPRAPTTDSKRIRKPGEERPKVRGPYIDRDGRVKHYKRVGEEIPDQPLQGFAVGNYARVLRGPHRNLTGKIVSVDEDTARVVLKMVINKQTLEFSQHYLEVVSREESLRPPAPDNHTPSQRDGGKQYGLINNRDRSSSSHQPPSKRLKEDHNYHPPRGIRESSEKMDHQLRPDEKSHSTRDLSHSASSQSENTDNKHSQRAPSKVSHGSSKDRKRQEDDKGSVVKGRSWLYPNLRVRMIDQKYRKGKYYNTKVVILDVVSVGECVCQTDTRRLLEGVTESMLETVVPRAARSKVMIVGGAKRGKIATIIEQDRQKARAVVEMVLSKEVLQVDFDDICEYIGTIDDAYDM